MIVSQRIQNVFERLAYERLLMTRGITPARRRIRLDQVLDATKIEPRVFEVLPAIVRWRPSIINRLDQDLKKYPQLSQAIDDVFDPTSKKTKFYSTDRQDCLKAAKTYQQYLEAKQVKQKIKTMNLRLSYQDISYLKKISDQLEISSLSAVIRKLIYEKAIAL